MWSKKKLFKTDWNFTQQCKKNAQNNTKIKTKQDSTLVNHWTHTSDSQTVMKTWKYFTYGTKISGSCSNSLSEPQQQ